MIRKFVMSALAGASLLGFAATQAHAQANMQTQTFNFSGTCSGGNNVVGSPPITFSTATPPTGATLTSTDIVLFQVPNGLQYAYVSLAGNDNVIYGWLGPGQTHTVTTNGSIGNQTGAIGNGFALSNNNGINLTVACSSGNWQAWVTLNYHAP
jgi:hypothetical protein